MKVKCDICNRFVPIIDSVNVRMESYNKDGNLEFSGFTVCRFCYLMLSAYEKAAVEQFRNDE